MNLKSGTQMWMWDRCYGRDGSPLPTELNETVMVQEAINVDLTLNGLPQRRVGSTALSFGGAGGWSGHIKLGRFFGEIAGVVDEYLFWTDSVGQVVYGSLGTTPIAVIPPLAPDDGRNLQGWDVCFVQFNNKMYRGGSSSIDRLHVFDPTQSPETLRRVGLAAPLAASVADSGSPGTVSGFRYYRVQHKTVTGGRTQIQSNLGDPIGFNPSGGADAVVVTRNPSVHSENPTHWVVWASADGALYYNISGDIPIGTLTFLDTNTSPGAYANFTLAPEEGAYSTWPSVKFLLAGIDRLIGFGSFGGGDGRGGIVGVPGRVYFSPVLGTTNTDDDERVLNIQAGQNPAQGWIDVGKGLGETDRGLGGPIDGNALVFQSRGIYLLVPTGNALAPFKRVTISQTVGAIEGSIFNGQDELGRPCVYFADETAGPYRYGANGLQWLGFDVQDQWKNFNRTSPEFIRCHGVFHLDTTCAMFWVTVGGSTGTGVPTLLLRFNARFGKDTGPTGVRFGWTIDAGDLAGFQRATGSVLARRSIYTADAANAIFQPWIAQTPTTKLLMRNPVATDDDGALYAGSVTSKVIGTSAAFQVKQLVTDFAYLQAQRANATIRIRLVRNYGDQDPVIVDRSIGPPLLAAEDRVIVRAEGLVINDAFAVQVNLTDPPTPSTVRWLLDWFSMPIEVRTQERWNTG